MDCPTTRSLFTEYRADALPPRQREGVEAHLNDCPKCALEYRQLEAILAGLRDLDEPKAPREVRRRVMAVVRERAQAQRRQQQVAVTLGALLSARWAAARRRSAVWAGGAAVGVVALALAAVFVVPSLRSPQPAQESPRIAQDLGPATGSDKSSFHTTRQPADGEEAAEGRLSVEATVEAVAESEERKELGGESHRNEHYPATTGTLATPEVPTAVDSFQPATTTARMSAFHRDEPLSAGERLRSTGGAGGEELPARPPTLSDGARERAPRLTPPKLVARADGGDGTSATGATSNQRIEGAGLGGGGKPHPGADVEVARVASAPTALAESVGGVAQNGAGLGGGFGALGKDGTAPGSSADRPPADGGAAPVATGPGALKGATGSSGPPGPVGKSTAAPLAPMPVVRRAASREETPATATDNLVPASNQPSVLSIAAPGQVLVGQEVAAVVTVNSPKALTDAALAFTVSEGLTLRDGRTTLDKLLFPANEAVKIPMKLVATSPGTKSIEVKITTADSKLVQTKVARLVVAPGAEKPPKPLTRYTYRDAELRAVLETLAREAGKRAQIAPDVKGKVTFAVSAKSADAALRELCRRESLTVAEQTDTYRIGVAPAEAAADDTPEK